SAGSQYARYLCQKLRERMIAMGRLDIDHRVEGIGLKPQIFSVALDKDQPVHLMPFFAKSNPGGIQVQGSVLARLQGACEVSCSPAVAATHFQDIFGPQFDLRGDVMV